MVRVELIDTGHFLTLVDGKITYVKQVAEIGDITKLNASYSWTLKFPKNPENSMALESLGVVGSTSNTPYTKIYVNVYDNGSLIVQNGLLNVTETSEEYKIYVQDGIVEFIRDVSNDKIGETIDLSELDHINDANTIIDSFENYDYRYIIANYNGAPLANINYNGKSITDLNPIALIPSVNVKFLFDKIMEYYGWTYEGSLNIDNLWMTYPNAPTFEELGSEAIGLTALDQTGKLFMDTLDTGGIQAIPFNNQTLEPNRFEYVLGTSNTQFRCLSTGVYRIVWNNLGFVDTLFSGPAPFTSRIYVNGLAVSTANTSLYLNEKEVTLTLNNGDILTVGLMSNYGMMYLPAVIQVANLSAFQLGVVDVDFSKALIKYKTKDFFKELMIRASAVAFTDNRNKHIRFVTLDERLDADVVDFSSKYIRRKSEKYLYNSYAQNNYIKHKYDEDGADYDDGNLTVENANLSVEKPLFQSDSYAPLEQLVEYNGWNQESYFVNNFKMFEVEVKEDVDTGVLSANYKPLKNRFYFMRSEEKLDTLFILGQRVDKFPVAQLNNVAFKDVVSQRYSRINQLIAKTKVHQIELALSTYDVETFELDKVYYFAQEKAHYIVNNIKYTSGDVAVGEFVKINKGL